MLRALVLVVGLSLPARTSLLDVQWHWMCHNLHMVTNNYAQQLKRDFPSLNIQKIEVIGKGWHHDAVEVNDSIVFRIPRGVHEQSDSVGYETAVLKHFQGLLPVQIPNPTFIALNEAYFGYPKVPGELLINLYSDFNEQDKARLREDWVNIAVVIHQRLSVNEARRLKVPEFEVSIADAQEIFSLSGIDEDVLDFARQIIEFVSAIDLNNQNMSFIHNDIQFHNLLIDPHTKRLTGLIDWTDVCVAPIAREFSAWEWLNDEQLRQVIGLYEEKTGNTIDIQQAKIWKYLEELSDFVEHVRTGEQSEAEQSLNHIKQWMAAG